ncbi:peptidylprolyl isomerase [Castellaniella caeni]|uniref:peptidylprolyl isomerase n=1 Tax=Castellaniella caeni TaxID=266123 RepID=UPI00083748D8|nr:peptidylprolyl isomerase [Castellaniella caeni]
MTVCVNGVAVDTSVWPDPTLAAIHELLRQQALQEKLLSAADGEDNTLVSDAIEALLRRQVKVPVPRPEECRRYYIARPGRYRHGDQVEARHILLQVTPGVPVGAIRDLAEQLLAELYSQPALFATRARERSNCPSGAQGGTLGLLRKDDCMPEFASQVFGGTDLGVLPELISSRHGFHIVAVDRRIPGELPPFDAVAERVAQDLRNASEQRALEQYVRVLAGRAKIEGADLGAVSNPLVQ